MMTTQTETRAAQTETETWVPRDTFARRLVDIRHEKRLTVEQAAEVTGLSGATWSTWERGSHPRNMAQVVAQIALALRVDRDWLMWGEAGITRRYPRRKPLVA